MTAGSIAVPSIIPLRIPSNGKLKNVIDTYTPIELKSETPNAEIFFTVDGSKPDPFTAIGADRNTIKYSKPFKLREGKKTVKALAVSRDGTRQSHVVTKCFEVEKQHYGNDRELNTTTHYDFIDELERERKKEIVKKRSILKKIVDTNMSYRNDGGGSDDESARHHTNTKYLGNRFGNQKNINFTVDYNYQQATPLRSMGHSSDDLQQSSLSRRYVLPDSSFQTLRLQRETDFLKCIYCFAPRPNDPHAIDCSECNQPLPRIPQSKLITPQPGQMGVCFYCKSNVPFNTTICVICEMPITPQLQPQTIIRLQGKNICTNCTTSNPANYTSCVACNFKLFPSHPAIYPGDANIPQYPLTGGNIKNANCSQCFRINRVDARFCDWCGVKPQKIGLPSSNHNASTLPATSKNQQHQWLNNIDSKAMQILNKQYSSISTQTYGLFYTSAKGLENKEDKLNSTILSQTTKTPLLTAVSAGKGYWRQQMDHICAHLKAFAQNNSEFRVLVGEPRLGKLNSAKVDIDANWCTITASFPIRNHTTQETFNSSAAIDHALNPHNTSSHFSKMDYELMANAVKDRNSSLSDQSLSEDDYDSYNLENKQKKTTKKKVNKKLEEKLSGEDRQLIKEIGKQGRGRPKEVRHLLNEGANPNAVTKDGLSVLHLAIRYKHFECIPILLESSADINFKIPPKGNTVLHEAVLLGSEASNIIKLLIDFGANPKWKNNKNETAFELAIKENNTSAVNVLGSQVGTEMINTYLKAKS